METRNTTLAWDHWHIEASSICTLKCPRCPRAEVSESLLNRSLTLDFFKNRITGSVVKEIKKITFCGNDGDPIYCRDFLEIIQWLKEVNPIIQLTIITNGSWKPLEWWINLAKLLNHNDTIHWSLDGWSQESNEQYRINSNWDSIIQGIETFVKYNSSTYRVWASIAFKFNENHLDDMKSLAKSLGFDRFQITKSTKFGAKYPDQYPNDSLEPTESWIPEGHRFERVIENLTEVKDPNEEIKKIFFERKNSLTKYNTHSGICLIGNKGVFLNSRGEFYPCCWVANRYSHNEHWHTLAQSRLNLWNTTFRDILKDSFWHNDFLKFDSQECKTKCTPDRLKDDTHCIEW